MIRRIFTLVFIVFAFSCSEEKKDTPVAKKVLFTKLSRTQTDISFRNEIPMILISAPGTP